MEQYRLAFVDLETSGVSPAHDRVTEIGIVLVDSGEPVFEWSSLVDPGVPIPPEIQALTGITNEMVRGAPRFEALAGRVRELLDDRIFVAHNARFDYGFLKSEFRRLGERFSADVLCTVRLSRRVFPHEASHGLDALIDRHRLDAIGRHRALGDARLIARFAQLLWREQDRGELDAIVRSLLKQPARPPHLPAGALETLPESPGVYVFRGVTGQPLYVGKARNLRDRVRGHFYADSQNSNDARLSAEVHAIDVEETAGEFGALLREIELIKGIAPLHNIALRRRGGICFLRPGAPGRAPNIVALGDADPLDEPDLHGPFGTRQSARAALAALGREHALCDRALGLWAHEGPCFQRQIRRCAGYCVGAEAPEDHQHRLLAALAPLKFPSWPFGGAVRYVEQDAESGRHQPLLFDRWCAVQPDGTRARFDPDVFKLLRRTIARSKSAFEPAG